MAHKDKLLNLRISEKLLEEYRQFCEEKSMNLSKRIRRYMEIDIENWKASKLKKINNNNEEK
jgi:hypothetical protein